MCEKNMKVNKQDSLISIQNLSTKFFTNNGTINAVNDINLNIECNSVTSIVGESGSGKSVAARSILNLIEPPGQIVEGEIWYHCPDLVSKLPSGAIDGEYVDLLALSGHAHRMLRASEFGFIFQDPTEHLNSSLTVGRQIAEAIEINKMIENNHSYSFSDFVKDAIVPGRKFVSDESYEQAIKLLERVNIPDPGVRADEYPHQFSGGMQQRAMIAIALAGDPNFIIADEPTTGLDVTIQSGVLSLIEELQSDFDMSVLIISHDLGVVSRVSDQTAVMYAGEFLEVGPTKNVIQTPANPYTKELLNSQPNAVQEPGDVSPIEGNVPELIDEKMGIGCPFADRCPESTDECTGQAIPEKHVQNSNHRAKCIHIGSEDYNPNRNKKKQKNQ